MRRENGKSKTQKEKQPKIQKKRRKRWAPSMTSSTPSPGGSNFHNSIERTTSDASFRRRRRRSQKAAKDRPPRRAVAKQQPQQRQQKKKQMKIVVKHEEINRSRENVSREGNRSASEKRKRIFLASFFSFFSLKPVTDISISKATPCWRWSLAYR